MLDIYKYVKVKREKNMLERTSVAEKTNFGEKIKDKFYTQRE